MQTIVLLLDYMTVMTWRHEVHQGIDSKVGNSIQVNKFN